jgi:hypothetical protein
MGARQLGRTDAQLPAKAARQQNCAPYQLLLSIKSIVHLASVEAGPSPHTFFWATAGPALAYNSFACIRNFAINSANSTLDMFVE